jgi:hypothetical protein
MADEQCAQSVVRNTCKGGGSDQYMPHHTAASTAALVSALNSAMDARPSLPNSFAPPPARHHQPYHENSRNRHIYTSRPIEQPVEQFDTTPATWSAWINEERRRSEYAERRRSVDFEDCPKNSHSMPPHFLDPQMAEIDDLASRLPQGLLGGMLDSDNSDSLSRSTFSRRARLGTEGSAPIIPGMDLFRHEESHNLSRCALHPGNLY